MKKIYLTAAVIAGSLLQAHAQLEWFDPIKEPQIRPTPAHFDIISKAGGIAYFDTLDGSTWKNKEKNVLSKDANGNFTNMNNSYWDSATSAYINKEGLVQTLNYNSNNQVTSARMVVYNNGQIAIIRNSNYTYETNGRFLPVTGTDSIFESSNVLAIAFKDSVVYNASGKIAERIKSYIFMGMESPRERSTYTYNSNQKLTKYTKFEYNDGAWTEVEKLEYTYTSAGNLETVLTSSYDVDNSTWLEENLDSFYYNGSNLIVRNASYYNNNNSWSPDNAEEYVYSGNNITEVYEFDVDGANFVNRRKIVIAYTGNTPTSANIFNWGGSDWATTATERVRFEQLTVSVNKLAANHNVNVYPNPASDVLTIDLPKLNNANVAIYNMAGMLVKSAVLTVEPTISVADLNNGVYIVEVKKDAELLRTKFVKN